MHSVGQNQIANMLSQDMKAVSAPPRMMFGFSKWDPLLARDCGGQQHDSSQEFEAEQVPFEWQESIGNFRLIRSLS